MDVDEPNEQSEANNDETVNRQEIASSSRVAMNPNKIKYFKDNQIPTASVNSAAINTTNTASAEPYCETMVAQNVRLETFNDSQEGQQQQQGQYATIAEDNINEEEPENLQHIENAGVNPNYSEALHDIEEDISEIADGGVQSVLNSIPEVANDESNTAQAAQTEDENASAVNLSEEDHQNEQHIENAGIDPNYPLVLVRRVSIPSAGNSSRDESLADSNNEDPISMEDDNNVAGAVEVEREQDNTTQRPSSPGVVSLFNSASAEESGETDEEVENNVEYVEDVWSEDDEEDEAAFLENPNFRGFANQFEAIRNMIAETRRSMAEAEASFGPIARNSLMQRFLRMLFILNNRRRRLIRLGLRAQDEEMPGIEVNPVMVGVNDAPSDNAIAEVAATPANEEDNNMTMEQEEEMNENAVRFDTNLPAEHSYMGANMNRVSGVNYLEADQYVKLRLFIHQHVLFPGEVLPFMVDSSTTIIEGDVDAQNGILFGVCFPCLSINKPTGNGGVNGSPNQHKDKLLYGVTCQIYELGEDGRSNTLIKSRALQRFVTKASDLTVPLEYINALPRMKCFGFVKILPDTYLPDPLNSINMGSMKRFRDNTSMQSTYKRFQAATTPWPSYVYETHNISNIIEKARTQLAQHKIDIMPSDPTQLSYWLVRNLHLPDGMMKPIFLANSVNTRLKLIASTFKKEAIFCCRNCVIHIADCRELFAMSKHGVQSQYCNSAGYIHETNTLYQVNRQNILHSGSPSTEFSWFPGYQWHIIICKICKHHLGWEFKAVEPNLIPKHFYGISSSSVRVRMAQDRNNVPVHNAVYIDLVRLMNSGINELREARNNMANI